MPAPPRCHWLPAGERYEGEWREGRESGMGTLASASGATYFGQWKDGAMDGDGVYRPAAGDNRR